MTRLEEALKIVSDWAAEYNDVGGLDADDLVGRLERAGFELPEDE